MFGHHWPSNVCEVEYVLYLFIAFTDLQQHR
jgi:hypothetical protein